MSIALSNGVSRLSIREMSFKQWRQRTAESGKMQLSSPPSLISYLHCKEIYILGAFRGQYQRHLCYWERLSEDPISLGGNEPVGRWLGEMYFLQKQSSPERILLHWTEISQFAICMGASFKRGGKDGESNMHAKQDNGTQRPILETKKERGMSRG